MERFEIFWGKVNGKIKFALISLLGTSRKMDVLPNVPKDLEDKLNSASYGYGEFSPDIDSIVRKDQEEEIKKSLLERTPVLVRGAWRIGKTTMIRSITDRDFNSPTSLYIDCAGLGELSEGKDKHTKAGFISSFEIKLRVFTERFYPELSHIFQGEEGNLVERLNESLKNKGVRVVLAFDEVLKYEDKPEILEYINNLKSYSNIDLVLVLHKRLKPIEDMFEKVFRGFKTVFIRQLRIDEVEAIIMRPLKGTNVVFTEEAIQKICEFTGSRPLEIKYFCHAMFNRNSKLKNIKDVYGKEDIERLIRNNLEVLKEYFPGAVENYKRIYKSILSPKECKLITTLVRNKSRAFNETDMPEIQSLMGITLVIKNSDNTYSLNGELLRRVLKTII